MHMYTHTRARVYICECTNDDLNLVVWLSFLQSSNLSYYLNYFKGVLWKYLLQSPNLPNYMFVNLCLVSNC